MVLLKYNQSTGSDTAASGTNAPTTAVTGTNGSLSTTTLTLNETKDFTGVLDNDEDCVSIATTGNNRRLYRITGFTGGVSTCTALVLAESGPTQGSLTWAVGGKRLSLDTDTTNPDIEDYLAGWTMELEGTAVTYSPAAASLPMLPTGGSLARGPVIIRGAAGATVTITAGTSTADLFTPAINALIEFHNLTLTNTGTGGSANLVALSSGSTRVLLVDVAMSSFATCVNATGATLRIIAVNSSFKATSGYGIDCTGGRVFMHCIGCLFYENSNSGVAFRTSTTAQACSVFDSCLFRDNTLDGLSMTSIVDSGMIAVANCVFHGNLSDGIEFDQVLTIADGPLTVHNCIFTENAGHGIGASGSDTTIASDMLVHADYNAFRNNTSGNRQLLTAGAHDVTLTADPYTNEAGNDFSINLTAGGGAACTDTGLGRVS
jgi:hypothetical protein